MAKKKKKKSAVKKNATVRRKATKKGTMSLADIYNEVTKRADKTGIAINAAESKRVMACFFDVLEDQSPKVAFDLVAKGLAQASKRRR